VVLRMSFPSLSAVARSGQELEPVVRRAVELTTVALVTMVTPIVALSPLWLPALFGSEWERATSVIVAVGIAFMASGPLNVLTGALYAVGRPRSVLVLNGLMLVLFVVLSIVGVQASVLIGVAVAWAIARVFAFLAAQRLLRSSGIKVGLARPVVLLVAASATASGVAWTLRTDHYAAGALVVVVASALWARVLWADRHTLLRFVRPA
jgi:O-antigen/teichoic acid export membrane protein